MLSKNLLVFLSFHIVEIIDDVYRPHFKKFGLGFIRKLELASGIRACGVETV